MKQSGKKRARRAKSVKDILEAYDLLGKVDVSSFNEDGTRYSTYGNIDIVSAFREVLKHTQEGRRVIIHIPVPHKLVSISQKDTRSYDIYRGCYGIKGRAI